MGKKRYFYVFLSSMTFLYFRENEGHFKGHNEEEFNSNSNKKGFRAIAWSTILRAIRKLWKIANYFKIELWLDSVNWSYVFEEIDSKMIHPKNKASITLLSAKIIHLHLAGNNKYHYKIPLTTICQYKTFLPSFTIKCCKIHKWLFANLQELI